MPDKPPRKKSIPPVEFRFKKGQSGNPQGARLHNPIPRALKNLTVESYRKVIELVVSGNFDALQEMIKDPKTSVLQIGIATAFYNAMKGGDYETIERIASRIVGKIPDEIKIVSQNQNQNQNLNANADVTKDQLKAILGKLEYDI